MVDIVWLFQGMEDFRKTSIRNITVKIASVLMVFLMVKTEDDVPIYIAINAVSALVSSLVLWLYIPKLIIRVKVPWDEVKKHIYPVITLFIPMIAIYVYTYVDKIVLGLLSTEAQVGFYSNAERIVKLPMTVITSLGSVMIPRVASLIKDEKWNKVREDMRKSIHFVFFLGFPMAAGIAVIARYFVPCFFGAGYEECIPLMQELSVIIIIIGLSSVTGQAALVPLNKQKIYTISILVGAVMNLFLNIMLIPILGAQGAVIGTITAESMVGIIQWIAVFKGIDLKLCDVLHDNIKPFLGAAVMLILLVLVRPMLQVTVLYTILYGVLGCGIYFGFMLLSRDSMVYIGIGYLKNAIHKGGR